MFHCTLHSRAIEGLELCRTPRMPVALTREVPRVVAHPITHREKQDTDAPIGIFDSGLAA